MAELPSDIIYNIFSRLPIKSLARLRCLSKLWCDYIDSPHLAIIHKERSTEQPTLLIHYNHLSPLPILSFNITKSKEGTTLLKAKTDPFFDLECSTSKVQGSCNGLIYLSQRKRVDDPISFVVIHPLRKECYEVPPMEPLPYSTVMIDKSCGLGFDSSTKTFKMVCVISKLQGCPVLVRKNLCTLVHVLGTDSWREIPQVSSNSVTGEGVFANGCLYWLKENIYHPDFPPTHQGEVIRFDVKTEEFGTIHRPKETRTGGRIQELVDLHGEVGCVYYYLNHSTEVWVLKEKEWVMHCWFDQKPSLSRRNIKVLGRWNKDGDILIRTYMRKGWLLVYNLKSGLLDQVKIAHQGNKYNEDMLLYPANNLFSIHGINYK